jgi:hypothetical protein
MKQLEMILTKMHCYLDTSQNSPQATHFSYTKQYSTPSASTEYNSGIRFPLQNIKILERFEFQALRMLPDVPSFVPNTAIRRYLHSLAIKEQFCHYNSQYSAPLSIHPNDLAANVMAQPNNMRLRKHLPNDLPTRFLV